MSKRNIFAAYLSLSSPLSDERRSLRRYLGPRRSESFITVVEGTDLVYFTLVCILTFFPAVAIFFSLRILRSHAQSICSNYFRAKIYVTRNYGTLLSFQNWTKKLLKFLSHPIVQQTSLLIYSSRQHFRRFMNYLDHHRQPQMSKSHSWTHWLMSTREGDLRTIFDIFCRFYDHYHVVSCSRRAAATSNYSWKLFVIFTQFQNFFRN